MTNSNSKFDPVAFGEAFKELRGNRSQPLVEKESGVPQHIISPLERGETKQPSFITVIQLGLYYGLSPNDMAALAGLYAPPGAEEDQFPPHIASTLQKVWQYMLQLEHPDQQRRFAELLEDAQDEMEDLVQRDDLIASSKLPSYIRKKLMTTRE